MASGDSLLIGNALHNDPPAASYAYLSTRNGHPILVFSGTADEEAVFKGVLPRHYSGAGLTVNLWIALTTATSGTSRWQVAIERILSGTLDIDADSFDSFQSNGGAANGTSGVPTIIAVALTNGQIDGLLFGEMFRMKVRRDADGTSGTDDITTTAELLGWEIRET